MGTADTPAAPIIGLTLPPLITYISFPSSTPLAVPIENAISPSPMMNSVSITRNSAADILLPTLTPSSIVTMLTSSFCAVFERRSTTPASRRRLPSMSMPTSGVAAGMESAMTIVVTTGNTIFTRCDTCFTSLITTTRSFSEVRARMIGGWITGTRAMYEYAATAIGPSRCSANCEVR